MPNAPYSFKGRSCAITGGLGSIALAIARAVVSAGATRVHLIDALNEAAACSRNDEVAPALAQLRQQLGDNLSLHQVDLGRPLSESAEFSDLLKKLAPDAFFGVAGISGDFQGLHSEQLELQMRVNYEHNLIAARALLGESPMIELSPQPTSLFVILASSAGLLTTIGNLPYSISKRAAAALADWLAVHASPELRVLLCAPQGVRSNMVPKGSPAEKLVGINGMITADDCAVAIVRAAEAGGQHEVLPHADVRKYYAFKAADSAKWLAGMQRLAKQIRTQAIGAQSKL